MSIEEALDRLKRIIDITYTEKFKTFTFMYQDTDAIETLLTAYETLKDEDFSKRLSIDELLIELEKEKEKNKKIDEFCRKELAFERRLKRENIKPDEFNQGRFYVCENIRKIIKEE